MAKSKKSGRTVSKTVQAAPVPAKKADVKITAAKGRPMLTWVGKRPLMHVTAFPAQRVEYHDAINLLGIDRGNEGHDERMKVFRGLREHWNGDCWKDLEQIVAVPESGGMLYHGDNKEVLAHLLANGFRGKVNLIYIDPPFDSGADYVRQVSLRGINGTTKIDGESYSLGEQIQYPDIWANDNYLQFMYERLLLLRELLSPDGTIYLHCDWHRNHQLRCLMDEVFGSQGTIAEVVWQRSDSHNDATYFGVVHDSLLVYCKSETPKFNKVFLPISQRTADNWYRHVEPGSNRRYNLGNLVSPHPRPNLMYEWKGVPSPAMGWRVSKERMGELDAKGLLVIVGKGANRTLKVKQYLDESKGRLLSTWWDDISQLRGYGNGDEKTDYPTQKPEELLVRILNVSSEAGDIVLDCFIGSGTTAAVAQKLGRRWIGCDINKGAIQTTVKRLRSIVGAQIAQALADKKDQDGKLIKEAGEQPRPCQFGFTVWRVNDYDLQVQHNEAVNLACEHIGVERTRTDSYFDGTLGKNLVKIVPFGHPLTPLDLEELKRELEARPDEDRNITLVSLGMELGAKTWIDDWNRLRKGKAAVNRIGVIELRTDSKYGKFIQHQPAQAKVKISRKGETLVVEIADFISPTIIDRLAQQAGVLQPKIDDWRAMVDCVMIDPAYDGKALNVVLADVPEKKADLVSGHYELPAPADKTTVAVRITDMLGEEVLVTKDV